LQDQNGGLQDLIISPSSSPAGDGFNIGLGNNGTCASSNDEGVVGPSEIYRAGPEVAEGLLDDPGFAFDADGNMIDGDPEERDRVARSVRHASAESQIASITGAAHELNDREQDAEALEDARVSRLFHAA
jgi:hypothetical protein